MGEGQFRKGKWACESCRSKGWLKGEEVEHLKERVRLLLVREGSEPETPP